MTTTEKLVAEAYSHGAETIDWRFTSDRIKGLYCDGVIAISDRLTGKEQAAVLAEEFGHHLTASGNILDQSITANRKQELRGRIWAYNRLIGLTGILKAYMAGCRNRYEMAESWMYRRTLCRRHCTITTAGTGSALKLTTT